MTLVDLVVDSEDEEFLFCSKELLQSPGAANQQQSDPPTKTAIMVDIPIASTSRGEIRAEPEVVTKKPRPKPRKKLPAGSINAAPLAPPSDSASTITLPPRNVPTTVPLELALPAVVIPQDIPLTIADRVKSRVKGPPSNLAKKRKSRQVVMDDDDGNDNNQICISSPQTIVTDDQPPPSFFASSSSSLPPPSTPLIQRESRKEKSVKRNRLANDIPPPEPIGSDLPRGKKSRPKPKKKPAAQLDLDVVGKSASIFASTSKSRPNIDGPIYKSAEVVDDSDEELGSLVLPPPHKPNSHSSLSDLSETTGSPGSKDVTPWDSPKRLVPQVVITTVPSKRTSSPPVQEGEDGRNVNKDMTGGSPKGKKRRKKAVKTVEEDYFNGLDDEAETNPKGKSKGKGKARDSMVQHNVERDEIAPPQDTKEDQENTTPPPGPVGSKTNSNVAPSSASRKTPGPISTSSFVRLNYGHSLASKETTMTMTDIIKKANSAAGTPSGVKSHSSLMKGSRSVLRKIAPLHARRKTPPPLPPKPPPPKKTKKQLELEEKWEEELEETIEGWGALSSQERELLRKQKRDMEMGYED